MYSASSNSRTKKNIFRAAVIIALIILLLYFFPIYRLEQIGPGVFGDYYSKEEIAKALYIGSAYDRREARPVLALAEQAFSDIQHTREENEQRYGLLSRYSTPADSYDDVTRNEHTLKLWSAHFDGNEGWMWVFYSSESYRADGSTVCGGWNIPALWRLERDEGGQWTVVQIREHP